MDLYCELCLRLFNFLLLASKNPSQVSSLRSAMAISDESVPQYQLANLNDKSNTATLNDE